MASTGGNRTGNKTEFDPIQYLQPRGNSQYLPLKWQLAWLRNEQPQAEIRTQLISRDSGMAIFQAEIKLPNGAVATGWGAESVIEDNRNDLSYLIAAENLALSRALSILGFGLEYATDFDPPLEYAPITLPGDNAEDYDEADEPASIELPLELLSEEEEPEETYEPEKPRLGEVRLIREETPRLRSVPRNDELEAIPLENEQDVPILRKPGFIGGPQLIDPAIEDRLNNVQDFQTGLAVKQIYNEARTRHNIAPDIVDKRSQRRYGKMTYELTLEQADEFLELIINSRPRA
ncbi:hypothetical protein [Candidatus Chlorohelix sp.]|uniref:hypothetical protein n=1 Tax=Candidatus Chlorohelix sp. TaxID=3139201 RepID=UPI003047E5D8